MLEVLLCSMLTILPDHLFRRFVQGKRIGKEITLLSVWFETDASGLQRMSSRRCSRWANGVRATAR